jgi:hypothetical protein
MINLTVTEITEGKKEEEKIPFWTLAFFKLLAFPFRLLQIFIGRKKGYMKVSNGKWTDLYPFPVTGHKIERKLVAETGFDNCINFYNLQTKDKEIDSLLKGKYFGEFHYETEYGIFLRQFKNPDEWPISHLVFIDKSDNSYRQLIKSDSSWTDWVYEHINDEEFNIITEPANTYTTRLKIKTATNTGYS